MSSVNGMNEMSTWLQVVVGIIAISGGILILDTGLAMNRARDALTRVNMASPAIYVGFPLVVLAALITDCALWGVQWQHIVEFILLVTLGPIGSAMGSMHLGRAMMLDQIELDARTLREDLRTIKVPHARTERASDQADSVSSTEPVPSTESAPSTEPSPTDKA